MDVSHAAAQKPADLGILGRVQLPRATGHMAGGLAAPSNDVAAGHFFRAISINSSNVLNRPVWC